VNTVLGKCLTGSCDYMQAPSLLHAIVSAAQGATDDGVRDSDIMELLLAHHQLIAHNMAECRRRVESLAAMDAATESNMLLCWSNGLSNWTQLSVGDRGQINPTLAIQAAAAAALAQVTWELGDDEQQYLTHVKRARTDALLQVQTMADCDPRWGIQWDDHYGVCYVCGQGGRLTACCGSRCRNACCKECIPPPSAVLEAWEPWLCGPCAAQPQIEYDANELARLEAPPFGVARPESAQPAGLLPSTARASSASPLPISSSSTTTTEQHAAPSSASAPPLPVSAPSGGGSDRTLRPLPARGAQSSQASSSTALLTPASSGADAGGPIRLPREDPPNTLAWPSIRPDLLHQIRSLDFGLERTPTDDFVRLGVKAFKACGGEC
jgi:hypothetical protein